MRVAFLAGTNAMRVCLKLLATARIRMAANVPERGAVRAT
jgi:hypothetical protein